MLSEENLSIWLWSGSIAAIPAGYLLCDGSNGTPDLKDKFIIGAGDTFDVRERGGVTVHNHPFTGDGHWHEIFGGTEILEGTEIDNITNTQPAAGTTDSRNQRPPFYALAYLMKII